MNYTDKILEEFEKLRIISVTVSDVDDDTYIHDEGPEYIKASLDTSIAQAVAEERKMVRAVIKNICNNYVEEVSGCEDVEIVRDKILSSLDKLTDK